MTTVLNFNIKTFLIYRLALEKKLKILVNFLAKIIILAKFLDYINIFF